jgi:geranylgeranyl diphosphate synthase type I
MPADPAATALPPSLAFFAAGFDVRLAEFVHRATPRSRFGPAAGPLAARLVRLLLSGGKRLRPALVGLGFRTGQELGGRAGGDEEAWLPAAVAAELVHAFALIQDDLMDGAHLRRGMRWPAAGPGPRGRRALGRRLLLADLAFVLADLALEEAPAAPARLAEARRVFGLLRLEAVCGQAEDLRLSVPAARRPGGALTPAAAARLAALKTGLYSAWRPLQLGAALAGPAGPWLPALRAYALPLGIAFQLTDDLLDLQGDPARTGKAALGDLREGKPTHVLAAALHRLDGEGRRRLSRLLRAGAWPEAAALVGATGAPAATRALAGRLVARSRAALARLPLSPGLLGELDGLAAWVLARDR